MTTRTWTDPIGGSSPRSAARRRGSRCWPCVPRRAAAAPRWATAGRPWSRPAIRLRTGPFVVYSNTPDPGRFRRRSAACNRSRATSRRQLDYHARRRRGPRRDLRPRRPRARSTHFLKFYYPELPPRRAFFLAQGDRAGRLHLPERPARGGPPPRGDPRPVAVAATATCRSGSTRAWPSISRPGPTPWTPSRSTSPGSPSDLKDGWAPTSPRLESLSDIHQMTPRDYRESWAWVHLMLSAGPPGNSPADRLPGRGPGPRRESKAAPLRGARRARDDEQVAAGPHRRHGVSRRGPQARAPRARPPDPPPGPRPRARRRGHAAPQKPGLFRRIGTWLGF